MVESLQHDALACATGVWCRSVEALGTRQGSGVLQGNLNGFVVHLRDADLVVNECSYTVCEYAMENDDDKII